MEPEFIQHYIKLPLPPLGSFLVR